MHIPLCLVIFSMSYKIQVYLFTLFKQISVITCILMWFSLTSSHALRRSYGSEETPKFLLAELFVWFCPFVPALSPKAKNIKSFNLLEMPFLYLNPAGYLSITHSFCLILLFSIYAFPLQLNYFFVF